MSEKELLQQLEARGEDVKGALGRFLQDRALYEKCYRMFMSDASFAALGEALETKNYKQAFEAAHTLKGVSANLGLLNIYKSICAIVEPLRNSDAEEALDEKYEDICRELGELKQLL